MQGGLRSQGPPKLPVWMTKFREAPPTGITIRCKTLQSTQLTSKPISSAIYLMKNHLQLDLNPCWPVNTQKASNLRNNSPSHLPKTIAWSQSKTKFTLPKAALTSLKRMPQPLQYYWMQILSPILIKTSPRRTTKSLSNLPGTGKILKREARTIWGS